MSESVPSNCRCSAATKTSPLHCLLPLNEQLRRDKHKVCFQFLSFPWLASVLTRITPSCIWKHTQGVIVHSRPSSETHNAFVESVTVTLLFFFFFFFLMADILFRFPTMFWLRAFCFHSCLHIDGVGGVRRTDRSYVCAYGNISAGAADVISPLKTKVK